MPGGTTFTILVLALCEWLLAGACEHLTPTFSGKIFWTKLQFVGITSVPLLWFFFILKFTTYDQSIKRRYQILFWLYPLFTNVLVWTNPLHRQFYEEIWLDTAGVYPLLDFSRGPLFWAHTAAAYMLLLVSTVMLAVSYNNANGVYRKQTELLLISALLPWVANVGHVVNLALTIDITPFALTLSLTIMYYALQRYGFLELVPVARDIVVENMADMVVVLDAKNRIVDINKSALERLDLVGQNVIGKPVREVIPRYQTVIDQYGDHQKRHEALQLQLDGQRVILDLQITPIFDHRQHFTGRIFSLRDITNLKQAEQTLLENEKALRAYARELEEQNKELDAFAHTVAHDLKQPLGVLLGYSTFLSESLGTLDQEMLKHSTFMIEQNTRKMSSIVNELLLFASLRKKDTIELQPVPMGEVVSSVLSRLDDAIRESQAHVVVPVAWPKAMGYCPWIEEIWVNLISNAIKYGGKPPYVILEAEPLQITEGDHQGSWIRFSVSDNGPGLTKEAQERLFQPFERLGQVKFEGSGLGLSIVQRITRRLGGWIGVESTEANDANLILDNGSGCKFYFVLPAARQTISD